MYSNLSKHYKCTQNIKHIYYNTYDLTQTDSYTSCMSNLPGHIEKTHSQYLPLSGCLNPKIFLLNIAILCGHNFP